MLAVPPFALANDSEIRVTYLSGQGLAGQLPQGWSPVVAADISQHDLVLSRAASLSVVAPAELAVGASVVVARWDGSIRAWVTVGNTTNSAGQLRYDLTRGGQYAFLLADRPPFAPAGSR